MSDGYEYVCEKRTNHISVHKLKLASSSGWPYWALPSALASLAAALYSAAASSPMVVILTAVLLLVSILYLAATRSQVLEESVTIMRGFGVQLTTRYRSGNQSVVLIEADQIDSVIINEAITVHRVIFYLAFIVKGKDRLAVAFEATHPRLNVLKLVYRDAHAAMIISE
eukprot:20472-Heterococcus_DN1.PRE.2